MLTENYLNEEKKIFAIQKNITNVPISKNILTSEYSYNK